ncbi:porin family protein [Photobacterium leiognathi]|uniref:outer membrane beta-barrel protein n=1 Tax=Photobacterium leiognathi TaxID=553611 RepID=UPI001EDE771D|nr:outer membrane beta-barrel protein [Photobacterium leiognathi]MCG3884836.1 porin family protein [Photobacterium leiognathi]
MTKSTKAIVLAALLGSAPALAYDNYFSLGATHVTSNGEDATGFGGSYAWFANKDSNIGLIGTASFASKDYEASSEFIGLAATVNAFDVNMGPIFKIPSAKWLRVYPMIGLTVAEVEACAATAFHSECVSDNETYFNYGIGAQASIPSTNFFVDTNIKKVTGDADGTIIYLGLGYHY